MTKRCRPSLTGPADQDEAFAVGDVRTLRADHEVRLLPTNRFQVWNPRMRLPFINERQGLAHTRPEVSPAWNFKPSRPEKRSGALRWRGGHSIRRAGPLRSGRGTFLGAEDTAQHDTAVVGETANQDGFCMKKSYSSESERGMEDQKKVACSGVPEGS